jgi:transcriptional regulator with XRE-family HTH domain
MALDLERLGRNIRTQRTGRGWSLGELAEKSGISKAYLSDLENGKGGRPNIQYLLQVASALETTIENLVGETRSDDERNSESLGLLPAGLKEFADRAKLTGDEVKMLAQLHFRGNRPRDPESWSAVYQVLKAVSGHPGIAAETESKE